MAITDNLISFWELEEASGTRVDAVVASANDLTDNNTVTQAAGKVGNAASFDSANLEWLSRASNSGLQTGDVDFAVCAWVNLVAVNANRTFVGKVSEWRVMYHAEASNKFLFVCGGNSVYATLPNPALASTWYFIVAQHNATGNEGRIQIDDGTVYTNTVSSPPTAGAGDFEIGRIDGYMRGQIDQVGFWKRLLTAAEVTWLYNSGNGRAYSELAGGVVIPVLLNQYWQRRN